MLEFLKKLKERFNQLSSTAKIALISGVVLMICFVVFIGIFAGAKNYTPIFYNITAAQSGDVIDYLKKQRIPFKINDRSGLIEVPKGEVYQIRMELARQGFPGHSHVGLEIFDKTKLGQTEFIQHVDYLRALQGELARSIETIQGIKSARVHIVLPKDSLFQEDQSPATASIIITYSMGFKKLNKNQIEGIVNLVANSVEGLKPENVKVIDSYGNVLTDILTKENNDITNGIDKKLSYKKSLEKYFAKRIQKMLERVVGKGKVIATITTDIDFTKAEKTMEFYDPENVAERSHQKISESSTEYNPSKGGVPGVASNVPSVMAQQGTKVINKNLKKLYNKNQEIVNYEISKTVSKVIDPVGVIKRISAAVLVDGTYKTVKKGKKEVKVFQPRTPQEMAVFKEIVKKAIGYNPKRNDQVEVSCVPFNYNELEEIKASIAKEKRNEIIITIAKYTLTIIILLVIFLVFLRPFIKQLMERITPPAEIAATLGDSKEGVEEGTEGEELEAEKGVTTEEAIRKKVTAKIEKEPHEILIEIIEQNPERVAKVVKQWLRG